ncbi:oxidoreductase [Prosthecomicrobium hirschii]|uniref:Oxidoreductase n=1 Tax=Prosthecodimorpha hirschii TaxID=665126 RepID=A0A0N8GEL5_9HYPH|nr:FAD-binding oxidoreductase [Prosthecomicrobium hirschii]KPL51857.1 oxidoreductase [Prosthecomicrobium hirschii]
MTAHPQPAHPQPVRAAPHAPSLYAATARDRRERPALDGDRDADVCIIGGGYTGLSAALHLAEAGRRVVLLEANRIGWGASGRNGGQLHSGQRQDVDTLEAWFGRDRARALFDLGEAAKATVKDLIARHVIACDWRDGLIHAAHKRRYVEPMWRQADKLRRDYGLDGVTPLDAAALAAAIGTGVYFGGTRDATAGHLQPLDFALGLARAAETAGATLHEATPALRIEPGARTRVVTPTGTVTADAVLVACNGYLAGLEAETDAHVMPIHNYVLATEPLGARADRLIPGREAVSDSRFVVHYWRLDAAGRMVFGGGETYRRDFPRDLKTFVRSHMLRVYPQLADAAIDFAWGGTLAVTMSRLPYIRRLKPGLYTAAGYSGQGVSLATFAGRLVAEAIAGDTARFDLMAALPARRFPGGRHLRHPSLVLAMTWYALRDRL